MAFAKFAQWLSVTAFYAMLRKIARNATVASNCKAENA
jgi:hypothetical protein